MNLGNIIILLLFLSTIICNSNNSEVKINNKLKSIHTFKLVVTFILGVVTVTKDGA